MEDTRIADRIERLSEEIKAIQDLERKYRLGNGYSGADIMAHASRKLRLAEIRVELEQLKMQGEHPRMMHDGYPSFCNSCGQDLERNPL